MDYFSSDYKRFLAEHYVFDAWQFIVNARKNIITAAYCYNFIAKLISKMSEEHKEWQDSLNKKILQSISENKPASVGFGYDDMPQFSLDILGIKPDYPFLIDKYTKDFFQYTRNAYDSIAQIANAALLANKSENIEKVDFNKISKVFNQATYSQCFPKTLNWILNTKSSSEFTYVSEFNNRIKHICDARIIMSQNLFTDDVTNKIDSFYKKGTQFAEQDICSITKAILDFTEREFLKFLSALTEEIKLDTYIEGRIHNLGFYAQQVKDEPQSTFTVIYVEVDNSINELPDTLRILFVNENDEISSLNCDYDEILVRNNNEKYLGKFNLDESITVDGLLSYRKYRKECCEGMLAFINHSRKNYSIKPSFMSGKIVRVGFDEPK
jgi:hypothetical protein